MTRPEQKSKDGSPWVASKDRATRDREAKRDAVLDAAASAFGENGFYRTSLDEIAERLGVSKPTIYYYAKSKEHLLEAVVTRAHERMPNLRLNGSEASGPGLEQLKVFLRAYAVGISDHYGRCLLQLSQRDLGEEATNRVRRNLRKTDGEIRILLQRGIDDGSIAPCNIRLTSFMLASALNGITQWFDPAGELDIHEVGEILVDKLVSGILPKA